MKQKAFSLNQSQKERLMGQLKDILRGYPEVAFAYLYGSFAENLPSHDIDVGVYLTGIGKEETTPYSLTLSQTLSREAKVPVDVRVLNFAPVSFVYQVIRGILISDRNEELRVHVVEETVRKYLDLKPIIYRGIKEAFG
ncbi:MAG: nucleotidyltransferase domain-containing protein [Deltaproteobacteria bacterium]|nr:nucleotidyltransferase domain-containing protein [Deltaproteobacteria bacterium]